MKAPLLSIACSIITLAACGNGGEEETSASEMPAAEIPDTLSRWADWAEESGDGLWEDGSHRFALQECRIYGGQEFPPFYNVEGMAFRGDTMYVSDPTEQNLAAVSLETGAVLWKAGEQGEGPGHFNGIGEIAAGKSGIAVCDMSNCRIQMVGFDGEFLWNVPVLCPFDVMWIGDTLLVLTLAEDDVLNMYDAGGEKLGSCGSLPGELDYLAYCNRHLHGMVSEGGDVLVVSRFLSGIWKIDPSTGETVVLAETVFPQGEMVNDIASGSFMVLNRDIFAGPDGMINVILPIFTEDGGRLSDGGEPEMVTVVHRYDNSGQYLDSWAAPGTVGIALMHGGRLYTADRYADGVVIAWDVIGNPQ